MPRCPSPVPPPVDTYHAHFCCILRRFAAHLGRLRPSPPPSPPPPWFCSCLRTPSFHLQLPFSISCCPRCCIGAPASDSASSRRHCPGTGSVPLTLPTGIILVVTVTECWTNYCSPFAFTEIHACEHSDGTLTALLQEKKGLQGRPRNCQRNICTPSHRWI